MARMMRSDFSKDAIRGSLNTGHWGIDGNVAVGMVHALDNDDSDELNAHYAELTPGQKQSLMDRLRPGWSRP